MRGKRLVQLTEVCSRDRLSASAVKEITGGDQQSARGIYQKKQKFVCLAVLHVLCNTVPSVNDEDGGTTRRLRCIEYGSRFVDPSDPELARGENVNVYARAPTDELDMAAWKHFLMWEMMRAAERRVAARTGSDEASARLLPPTPESVMVATKRLVERESTVTTFVDRHLLRTGAKADTVTLTDLHAAYERMCAEEGNKAAKPRGALKEGLIGIMGPCAPKCNGERNLWRGWRLLQADGGCDSFGDH